MSPSGRTCGRNRNDNLFDNSNMTRDPSEIHHSIASNMFEGTAGSERKETVPDWMTETDVFVLGTVSSYASVTEDIFKVKFEQERDNGRYLDLDNADFDTVRDSIQRLQGRGVIERSHRSYRITELGNRYADNFEGWPTASGFLSKYRLHTVVGLAGLVVLWIIGLPLALDGCRTVGFPGTFTCGLPVIILPLLLISGAILTGHGQRIGQETAAFIDSEIRYVSDHTIEENTFKDAVYSRLAYAVPAESIAAAAVFVLFLMMFDIFVMNGRLNNQIYGLTFDGFGGYLLAKSEFLRGQLRLSRGSDMQMQSGSDQVRNIFDGAFGFSLLILGFSLQFAAIFPVMQLNNLIWDLGARVIEFLV